MRRTRKTRSKTITLHKDIWLRNSEDIKHVRKVKLQKQGGKCAVSGAKITNGVLDHTHKNGIGEDGRIRGVLASEVNMLEGRFLKLFQRSKIEDKYEISFEDFLISLGNYLKMDNTMELFHFKYMDDFRKEVKRWNKTELLARLKSDFNIVMDQKTLASELVQVYIQHWVYEVEKNF